MSNHIRANTVRGNIRISADGQVQISGTTTDGEPDANNVVTGEFNGVQANTIHGDITFE